MNKLLASAVGLAMVLFTAQSAHSELIMGGSLFVKETGTVTATFLGHTAGYTNLLGLYYWNASASSYTIDNSLGVIFNNQVTPFNTTKDLGTFSAGKELVFGIYVTNEGYTYFTGDGNRNPDRIPHAVVDDQYNNGTATYVGFEDLYGGGDRDYDDLKFAFTNTRAEVPEPSIIGLFGAGLLALFFRRKNA